MIELLVEFINMNKQTRNEVSNEKEIICTYTKYSIIIQPSCRLQFSCKRACRHGKGNLLVLISMRVTNNGKEKAAFLPRVGREDTMMTAKLIYKGKHEYLPSSFTGYDKDLAAKQFVPLAKTSGVIGFDVPKEVANDLKQVKIRIGTKNEAVIYPAK